MPVWKKVPKTMLYGILEPQSHTGTLTAPPWSGRIMFEMRISSSFLHFCSSRGGPMFWRQLRRSLTLLPGGLSGFYRYCRGLNKLPKFWSHIRNLALVSDTSNRSQHDIGDYLGLYIYIYV